MTTNVGGKYAFKPQDVVTVGSPISAFGELNCVSPRPIFQYSFVYDYLSSVRFNTPTETVTGTVTVANQMLTAATGTSPNSTGAVETNKVVYYQPGFGARGRWTTVFSASPPSQATILAGFFTADNGYGIGYQAGAFGFFHRIRGTDNFTAMSSWNLDTLDGSGSATNPSGVALDPAKGNLWQISWQYLGFGNAVLEVGNPTTRVWTPVHATQYANTTTATNLSNPSLPFALYANNGASSSDVSVSTGSIAGFIEGLSGTEGVVYSQESSSTGTITATETPLLAIRGVTTFNSAVSYAVAYLMQLTFGVEGTKPAIIRLYKGASITGGTWNSVNATESIIEYNNSMTSATGTRKVASYPVGKSNSGEHPLKDLGVSVSASDVILVTGQTASGTSDAIVSLVWSEQY